MNLEAEAPDAFASDLHWLGEMKCVLERYYGAVNGACDILWLASASALYESRHQILNVLGRKMFTDRHRAALLPLLFRHEDFDNRSLVPLSELRRDIIRWLASFGSRSTLELGSSILRFRISSASMVERSCYTRLLYIVQNLLKNSIDHCGEDADELMIERQPRFVGHRNPYLSVRLKTFGRFPDVALPTLTVAPIYAGDRYHYGMFLVGVWARTLGGEVQVCSSGEATIIEVRVPLRAG